MHILTWESRNAPPSFAWNARFHVGKQILPVVIYAATEDAVIEKAQKFWDDETAKARGRMVGKHPRPQTTEDRINERGKPETVDEGDDAPAALVDDFKLLAEIKTRRATKAAESTTTDDLDDLLG